MTELGRGASVGFSNGEKSAEEALRDRLEELEKRQAEVTALLKGSRAVLRHRDFQDAAHIIFDSCKELIGASSGYVALLDISGTENEVLFLDSGGLPCTVDPALPMPIRGLREKAYRTGEAVYHNDFSQSEWVRLLPQGHVCLDNVLFSPLVIDGRTLGLLGLANKPGGFSDNDARMAAAFGEFAAIALQNSRTLESLEHSEERFRSLTQSATDGIISTDSSGNIIHWNEAAEKMFGYSAEEMMGQPLTRIMPERARKAHQDGQDRVVSGGAPRIVGKTIEVEGLRRDGSEIPIELSLATWGTREGLFFTGILRDITGRKQAEEALQKAKESLESEVEQRTSDLRAKEESLAEAQRIAHLGNWDWDIPGNTLAWSDEVYRIFGLRPQEFAPTYDAFLERVHPDDRPRIEEAVNRAITEPGTTYDVEHRVIRPDGAERIVHEHGEVTFDREGKPTRMIGTVHDVTQRKMLEREILNTTTDEQRRIGQELHDGLGQELTGLSYLATSLHQRLQTQGSAEAETAAELASGIPNAIRQLQTVVKGLIPLEIDAGDLVPALRSLAASVDERTGVRCRFETRGRVRLGDDNTAIQLYRIAQEAVNNAVKHGQAEHITVALRSDRSQIRLEVSDDGVGVGPDARKGSGSGLRIMQYRASVIGGTFEVRQQTGGGTLVTCMLPRGKA